MNASKVGRLPGRADTFFAALGDFSVAIGDSPAPAARLRMRIDECAGAKASYLAGGNEAALRRYYAGLMMGKPRVRRSEAIPGSDDAQDPGHA
jgi:hypothetical protein